MSCSELSMITRMSTPLPHDDCSKPLHSLFISKALTRPLCRANITLSTLNFVSPPLPSASPSSSRTQLDVLGQRENNLGLQMSDESRYTETTR